MFPSLGQAGVGFGGFSDGLGELFRFRSSGLNQTGDIGDAVLAVANDLFQFLGDRIIFDALAGFLGQVRNLLLRGVAAGRNALEFGFEFAALAVEFTAPRENVDG